MDNTRDAVELVYETLENFEWTEIREAMLIVISECICDTQDELEVFIKDLRKKSV